MPDRNFYLLTYDIADNRRRAKIARLMESLGERVQGSVFEAHLTSKELQKIITRSNKIMEQSEDSLRIYLLCRTCQTRLTIYGCGKVTPEPGLVVI